MKDKNIFFYHRPINKGNSSTPLFEIHLSLRKKTKSGLQTKTEVNTSNITTAQH